MLSLLLLIYVDTLKYRSIVFQNLKYTLLLQLCHDMFGYSGNVKKKKNPLPIITGKYI